MEKASSNKSKDRKPNLSSSNNGNSRLEKNYANKLIASNLGMT